MIPRIAAVLLGYCFGLFQTAYIYGKAHGVDIRKVGSGNAGTTNALRAFGSKVGILVFIGDCVKCILAALAAKLLFRGICPDILPLIGMYAGLGCILGHNFPFYMNFKGGKGIACTAGLVIATAWQLIPGCLIAFFGPVLLTHYVSLGSLLLNIVLPVSVVISGQMGLFQMPQSALVEMYILILAIDALAFYQHRENIKRLLNGTERKTYLFGHKGDGK